MNAYRYMIGARCGSLSELREKLNGNIRLLVAFPFAASEFLPFNNGIVVGHADNGNAHRCELLAL